MSCRPGRCCGGTHRLEGMQEREGACFHIWQGVLLLTKCQDSDCREHFKVDEPHSHIPGRFFGMTTRHIWLHNSPIHHDKVIAASVEAKQSCNHTARRGCRLPWLPCTLTHTGQNRAMISYRTITWSPAIRSTAIPENWARRRGRDMSAQHSVQGTPDPHSCHLLQAGNVLE